MYCVKQLQEDLYWVGGNDRRLALFESAYPIPQGVSYNAYLLLDEKTVLLDTVDHSVGEQLWENLEHLLEGRSLDYLVVNHMEPDHCAMLQEAVRRWPGLQVVGNAKTMTMIRQFFDLDPATHTVTVKEGDTLATGRHTLTFVMAPMVHWPEAMVTYDVTTKTLFSADAFGSFGAINGNLYADEVEFAQEWLTEARRYYTNIVGKYGNQVQALLKKAAGLEISLLCPLHGPVWRKDIGWFVEKYQRWSSYQPEDRQVMVVYASIYGHLQNAAEILAMRLAERGLQHIAMYDAAVTHPSYLLAEAFRCSHIVLAAPTYNAGLFPAMENFLLELKAHNLQNRTFALLENGTWAPTSGDLMRCLVEGIKGTHVLEPVITVRSALKEDQLPQIDVLADALAASLACGAEQGSGCAQPAKRRYVCKLCGYVYGGETLPADFVCPLCKRGADYFELQED